MPRVPDGCSSGGRGAGGGVGYKADIICPSPVQLGRHFDPYHLDAKDIRYFSLYILGIFYYWMADMLILIRLFSHNKIRILRIR